MRDPLGQQRVHDDELSISTRQNTGNFFQNLRQGKGDRAADVPDIGNATFADVNAGGDLTLQFLRNNSWVAIRLRLHPRRGDGGSTLPLGAWKAAAGRL